MGSAGKKYNKKAAPIKKIIQEPVAKKPVQEPAMRKSLYEPSTSRKQPVQEPPAPASAPTETSKIIPAPVSISTKAAKSAKASVSATYKTKTIAKKTPQISTFLCSRITFMYIMLSFSTSFSI